VASGLESSDVITFLGDGQTLSPTAEARARQQQDWLDSRYHVEKVAVVALRRTFPTNEDKIKQVLGSLGADNRKGSLGAAAGCNRES
jgi:hypothetical protein